MAALTTTTLILVTVTLFHTGLLIGLLLSDGEIATRSRVKTFVAIMVTLGWVSATVAGILVASYSVSPLLHALMGAIVGYFFTEDGINFQIGGR